MSSLVHVALGVNLANLPHAEVVVRSALAAAAEPKQLRFHILYDGAETVGRLMLGRWQLDNALLHPVARTWSETDMGPYSEASLLRLRLPSVLSAVERVIYLDADMLVRRDLAQLYAADLAGEPLGAVRDIGIHVMMRRDRRRGRTGMADYLRSMGFSPNELRYFNSGVLLMDLEAMRRMHAEQLLAQVWEQRRHAFIYKDQCLLNVTFRGRITELDGRWNSMIATLRPEHWRNVPAPLRRMARAQRRDPWITHYSGFEKPWLKAGVPLEDDWWRVAGTIGVQPWRRPARPPQPPNGLVVEARRLIRRGLKKLSPR